MTNQIQWKTSPQRLSWVQKKVAVEEKWPTWGGRGVT